ncbi:MAG TPA: hypothetical protein DEH78_05205 [Solibacterales bacterium]|nr:hypothetical protein [Bryobacterales bacterium]
MKCHYCSGTGVDRNGIAGQCPACHGWCFAPPEYQPSRGFIADQRAERIAPKSIFLETLEAAQQDAAERVECSRAVGRGTLSPATFDLLYGPAGGNVVPLRPKEK